MKKTLNDTEITQLFQFCEKHFVPYYDVQVELVDHLANAIEEELSINENIGFQIALEKVYKSFGKSGFRKIIVEKEIAIAKQRSKLFWQSFRSFFNFPIVLVTLGFPFLYFIFAILYPFEKNILAYISIGIFLLFAIVSFRTTSLVRREMKTPDKKLLASYVSNPLDVLTIIIILCVNISTSDLFNKHDFFESNNIVFILIFTFNWIGIIAKWTYYRLVKDIYSKYRKQYPAAFA